MEAKISLRMKGVCMTNLSELWGWGRLALAAEMIGNFMENLGKYGNIWKHISESLRNYAFSTHFSRLFVSSTLWKSRLN